MKFWLFMLVAIVASASTGFFVGRQSVADSRGSSAETGVPAGSSQIVQAVPLTNEDVRELVTVMESSGWQEADQWVEFQGRLGASDLLSVAEELVRSENAAANPSLSQVLSALARKDPQAAWKLASGLSGQTYRVAVAAVVQAASATDPLMAVGFARSISDEQLRKQLETGPLEALAKKDPQQALSMALTEPMNTMAVGGIFRAWASKNIESARSAAAGLTGEAARAANFVLTDYLADNDPEAAFQFAQQNLGDRRLTTTAVSNWAKEDPMAALNAAGSIADSRQRQQAIGSAMSAFAQQDFRRALDYALNTQDPELRVEMLAKMPTNNAQYRGELLDAILENMPTSDLYRQKVSGIMSGWARDDPRGAAEVASQLPSGRMLADVSRRIASQWGRDPAARDEALDWTLSLPAGDTQKGALRSLFLSWSRDDPQAALAAANSLSAEQASHVTRTIFSSWARKDPMEVLEWSEARSTDQFAVHARNEAITRWASQGMEGARGAADYVGALPAESQQGVLRAVVQRWASRDALAAAAWLAERPPSTARDDAIAGLTRKLAIDDPPYAIQWAGAITNPDLRQRETRSLVQEWIRFDPDGARQWVATSGLSPELKQEFGR